jgi:hypothetical protein
VSGSGSLSSALFRDFRGVFQLGQDIAGIHFSHGGFIHSESDQTLLLLALATSLWPGGLAWTCSVLISFCCSAHDPWKCLNCGVKSLSLSQLIA